MITSRQSIQDEIARVKAITPGLADHDLADVVAANLGADPFGVAEVIVDLRDKEQACQH